MYAAAAAAAKQVSELPLFTHRVYSTNTTPVHTDFEGLSLKYKKVITLHYKSSERANYLSILGSQPCLQIITSSFFKSQTIIFSCSGEINHPNLCVKLRRSTLAQNLAAAHRRQRNS